MNNPLSPHRSHPFGLARKISLIAALLLAVAACRSRPLPERLVSIDDAVREKALKELETLTENDRGALVAPLVAVIKGPDSRAANLAGDALVAVGPPSVPAAQTALTDADPYVRITAASVLRGLGPTAANAVPGLTAALADPHPLVREESAYALAEIGPPATVAVPALTLALNDKAKEVREAAEQALEKLGVAPRDAKKGAPTKVPPSPVRRAHT